MATLQSRCTPRKWRNLRVARRVSQGLFLTLFIWLIGLTAALSGGRVRVEQAGLMPYPVEAFLDFDPFAGLLVLLATHTIPRAMLLGLVVLGSALFLGRAFCGWICPMGTLNHLAAFVAPGQMGKRRLAANRTRPYQKLKYFVLGAAVMSALLGSAALGGLLDPLCLATRGLALTVLPWLTYGLAALLGFATQTNVTLLQHGADGLYAVTGSLLVGGGPILASGGLLLSVLFVAVLAANRFIPRFWCRGLCPLGALLGLCGRFGVLALRKEASRCTSCGMCDLHCSGAASPRPGDRWQRAECDLCLNCTAACKDAALGFGLVGQPNDEQSAPDLGRRGVLASAALGAALVPAMRTGGVSSVLGRPDPDCLRPPGAREEHEFLERCIRCGQCMKICPSNALHPALLEAGVEGLWTPVLIPRVGYCEPTCTLCTQVCPTGAIRRVHTPEKTGAGGKPMVRIGTAFIERGRCLPWAMGTPCIVCEEFCPVSPKAIRFEEKRVAEGSLQLVLKQPSVVPAHCNGCGACENVCPVHDRAAIRVSAAGESRSKNGALLLEDRVVSPLKPPVAT